MKKVIIPKEIQLTAEKKHVLTRDTRKKVNISGFDLSF